MVPVEPISLSMGAIALAGLFSACVQCFDYFDSAKDYNRDFNFLNTKLQTQKTRLVLWGESVGLATTEGPIQRLWWWESALCRPVIQSILDCIHTIFQDAHHLTTRYGLRQLKEQPDNKSDARWNLFGLLSISKGRMKQRQRQTSTARKARWAIHDKAKFETLINDLRQFIDGLEQITNPVDVERRRKKSLRDEIQSVLAAKRLRRISSRKG
ncbi:hypothetical protein N7G274_002959 [Stereocaulon virgatum]|uniref:Prion-inhibition and propagation HeLo domain-containing protein n=1 Tax=Stereocaulon virgatum TaxID=373712 RepID=A0ABR4AHR2_9LECA